MSRAIVIGAGIVGLATARALATRGVAVTVLERSARAVGASIRNFGMIWPIGQPAGKLYDRALRSREIWKDLADQAGIWYDPCGSLHIACNEDEWTVLQELEASFKEAGRPVSLLTSGEMLTRFNGLNAQNLIGGLFSETEMILDPRSAIAAVAGFLSEKYGVHFIWNAGVTSVESNKVKFGEKSMDADLVFICSGADFETLYPEVYRQLPLTRCKLQMMRFVHPDGQFRVGTSLCGGLSLIHYESFRAAPSLPSLKKKYQDELPDYLRLGIHVMVAQNDQLELTVGDSHEYGTTFDPFDQAAINQLIIDYLARFADTRDWKLLQSWHGIYPKLTDGGTEIFLEPAKNTYIINGVGGAGMTLSFGLAEEIVSKIL